MIPSHCGLQSSKPRNQHLLHGQLVPVLFLAAFSWGQEAKQSPDLCHLEPCGTLLCQWNLQSSVAMGQSKVYQSLERRYRRLQDGRVSICSIFHHLRVPGHVCILVCSYIYVYMGVCVNMCDVCAFLHAYVHWCVCACMYRCLHA